MRKQLHKRSLISALIATSMGLTACGGSDSSSPVGTTPTTPTTVSLAGKVNISGATVCLDKNINKTCDLDESFALTTSDGSYSFDVSDTDKAAYPVVAEIPVGAIRKYGTNNTTITKKYTLTSPPGKGALISPLTTMVQNELEGNPSLTAEQADAQLLTRMAVADLAVSLFEDYIDLSSGTSSNAAEYDRLRMIARVTETTIANNMETIEAVAVDAGTALTVDNLISMIVDEVVAALTDVVVAVDLAITAGDDSANFDETTALVDTVINTSAALDAAIAAEVVADTTTAATSVQTILANGIYWFDSSTNWFDYGNWGFDFTAGTEFEIEYDYQIGVDTAWVLRPQIFYQLTTLGWVQEASEALTFSETNGVLSGSSVMTDVNGATHDGGSANFSISVVDISGMNINTFLATVPTNEDDPAGYMATISAAATFPAGSEYYALNYTSTSSTTMYESWDNNWCDATQRAALNGFCNQIWGPNFGGSVTPGATDTFVNVFMTTATDVGIVTPSTYTANAVNVGQDDLNGNAIMAEFVRANAVDTTGVLQLIEQDWTNGTLTVVATATWDQVTVNGEDVLRILLPLNDEMALEAQGYEIWNGYEGMIFSHLGFLREGDYWTGGSTGTEPNFNQAATDAVFTEAGLPGTL